MLAYRTNDGTPMTADRLLSAARKGKPTEKYAKTVSGDFVGIWLADLGRFYPVACLLVTGEWVQMDCDYLVNGQRIERNWIA